MGDRSRCPRRPLDSASSVAVLGTTNFVVQARDRVIQLRETERLARLSSRGPDLAKTPPTYTQLDVDIAHLQWALLTLGGKFAAYRREVHDWDTLSAVNAARQEALISGLRADQARFVRTLAWSAFLL